MGFCSELRLCNPVSGAPSTILGVSQFWEHLAWNFLPQCHHLAPDPLWNLHNELNPGVVIPEEKAAGPAGVHGTFNL